MISDLSPLLQRAEQGDADAQCELGDACRDVHPGRPRNAGEAARWYSLAARQGHARACLELARLHRSGQGMARDEGQAMHWLELAAERGVAAAQYELALRLHEADDATRDDARAMRWALSAADAWHADALALLAALYRDGRGTPPDPVAAKALLMLARRQGSRNAGDAAVAQTFGRGELLRVQALLALMIERGGVREPLAAWRARQAPASAAAPGVPGAAGAPRWGLARLRDFWRRRSRR